jgi:hypothetical protein
MKYLKGTRFFYNYADWVVLDRYQNYVLVQGQQPGVRAIYTCTNVLIDGDNEDCRPFVANIEPTSDIYDLGKIRRVYDEQCALIDKRKAARQTAFEAEQAKDKARAAKLVKVADANEMKKAAQAALKELIFDGKTVKTLAKSAKVKDLMNEIRVCETIISTLI